MEPDTAQGSAQEAQQDENPFEGFETEGFNDPDVQKESPEPENAEAEADPEKEDTDGEEGEPEAPKKKTYQERINELTKARREAERREAELLRRLEDLEAARTLQPKGGDTSTPAPPADAPSGPPTPEDFEYGELDSRYITALVEYQTEQRILKFQEELSAAAAQQEAERRQREVHAKFQQRVEKGAAKYPDFQEKVVAAGAERGEWPLSAEMAEMSMASDVGEDVLYHLASHPEEALQVYRQTPVEQARYFGRLEAKFSAAQSAAPARAEETAQSKAPKAPPPVMPARGAGGQFQASASTDDFSSFEKLAHTRE
jgi:hypothetical protein